MISTGWMHRFSMCWIDEPNGGICSIIRSGWLQYSATISSIVIPFMMYDVYFAEYSQSS